MPYPEEQTEEEPVPAPAPTIADVEEEIMQDTIARGEDEVKQIEDRIVTENPEIQMEQLTETPETFEQQYDQQHDQQYEPVTEENLVVDVAGEDQYHRQGVGSVP